MAYNASRFVGVVEHLQSDAVLLAQSLNYSLGYFSVIEVDQGQPKRIRRTTVQTAERVSRDGDNYDRREQQHEQHDRILHQESRLVLRG